MSSSSRISEPVCILWPAEEEVPLPARGHIMNVWGLKLGEITKFCKKFTWIGKSGFTKIFLLP